MEVLLTEDREVVEAVLDRIEIAVRRFPRDLIARAPNLRWYQQWGAGADWLLRHPGARDHPVIITNVSGIHAVPISEHVFAMLLAFARGLPAAVRAQERHDWLTREDLDEAGGVFELADLTMLVVGVGAIGERIARLGAALEMHVLGVRRDPTRPAAGVERLVGPQQLLDGLPLADGVVITLPRTPETCRLFDASAFAAMKPGAYLINIGRGRVVDETALVEALRSGQVACAGLDVFEAEPLRAESPLWEMPNVIITAHYSGESPRYDERAMAIFLDNLRRYQSGLPLHHVIDKKRGY
jgi:phosphoglycerate dehydrogenase-like enzyme